MIRDLYYISVKNCFLDKFFTDLKKYSGETVHGEFYDTSPNGSRTEC